MSKCKQDNPKEFISSAMKTVMSKCKQDYPNEFISVLLLLTFWVVIHSPYGVSWNVGLLQKNICIFIAFLMIFILLPDLLFEIELIERLHDHVLHFGGFYIVLSRVTSYA